MTVRDNYRLCIVVERTACWPIMYVASVLVRNALLRHAFVATFAAHQWTSAVLDGRCIHKFIMPSSRTETESESADFFTKPAKTAYKILRTVTTLRNSPKYRYRVHSCKITIETCVIEVL